MDDQTSPRRRLRLFAAALAALALVLLPACSSDDGASDDGASEGDAAAEDAGGDGDGEAPVEADAVTIVDFAFDPPDLEVAAGTSVTFTNEDGATHTATAEDDAFDTGDLGQGDTGEVTLDEPGTYAYLCSIHNYMTGTITVQ